MSTLQIAAVLALLAAVGHSYLSERLFLRPLRAESMPGGVFDAAPAKRLIAAMFHLASVCWISMAISMLLLDPSSEVFGPTLLIYATVYGISGLGNFWAVGKPHPGGVLLLSAGAMILFTLYG